MARAPRADNLPIKMTGSYSDTSLECVMAIAEEGINQVNATTLEFRTKNKDVDLSDVVGSTINLKLDIDSTERDFSGLCVGVEFAGSKAGFAHFIADLRPWLWFMSRRKTSRIFQEQSTVDIIKHIIEEYGHSSDIIDKLDDSYPARHYCVQYRETDLDFLHRLMEEEGIYYYVEHGGQKPKIVLADSPSGHENVPDPTTLEYHSRDGQFYQHDSGIFDLRKREVAQSGKVTLVDYNFEKSKAEIKAVSEIERGDHDHSKLEYYEYPGHFRENELGNRYAKVLMESKAAAYATWSGAGNARNIAAGQTWSIERHSQAPDGTEFMTIRATHYLRNEMEHGEDIENQSFLSEGHPIIAAMDGNYTMEFEAIPSDEQYRAPRITPWPEISGVHTAVVTGPSGEEIYTDEYGRVKVQFHWDRDGENNENTTCFVRTMMPWTGKNWGMIAIPRIGQEVVVQFEEGDPDRPLVMGMLYNDATMPPYALPANQTQSGVKTNSSKGGGGANELMFEDKKDRELVRFVAERDYEQMVKNDATITVGQEKKDKGDMALTVHRNLTEKVKTGDHDFDVEKGNQKIHIQKNKTEKIDNNSTLTVANNMKTTVSRGNVTEKVKMGNVTHTLDMGNETRTLKMGNYKIETKLGKTTIKAMQGIDLLCGASKIQMTPFSIKIESPMVTIEGKAMFQIKGALGQVQAQGPLIIKGLPALIN